jgi:hypothetical protein
MTIKELTKERELLVDTCAKICHYAQEHSYDWDAKFRDENAFQHTSYTVACFIAQSSLTHDDGVEWEVVLDQLMSDLKTIAQWKEIISDLVADYQP